jgi:hypothetical protein
VGPGTAGTGLVGRHWRSPDRRGRARCSGRRRGSPLGVPPLHRSLHGCPRPATRLLTDRCRTVSSAPVPPRQVLDAPLAGTSTYHPSS